jgi:tetrahydromethanopterin S-methyltransferase subunit G
MPHAVPAPTPPYGQRSPRVPPVVRRLLIMASDTDSHVTVGGVTLGTRRRVAIDLALLVTVFGCIAGFMDMRAQTKAQTEAFRALSQRLDAVEERERTLPASTATKADIDRIDRRLDRLQELIIETARR